MNQRQLLCTGLAAGAGLMYLFDPDRGRRRRALIRDAAVHIAHATDDALGKAGCDLNNRATGVVAQLNTASHCEEVSDDVLVARVRTRLGRTISHPHAIEVTAQDGRVTLTGPIFTDEIKPLLDAVSCISGVRGITHQLDAYDEAGDIPALQSGHRHTNNSLWKNNWTPGIRLLAGVAGGALALYGAHRRDVPGLTLELTGLGLLARGITNFEMSDVLGTRGGHGISVQKTININAPVEKVYHVWQHHENFPLFMSRVQEVKDLGDNRYHWKVTGPAGIPVEWDGEITEQIPNKLIAFKSLPGAQIEQHGVVRFEDVSAGKTRVDVKLAYHPPAGVAGHAIAKLFGADPRSELIADLLRMKSYIETGHQPHDAAQRKAQAAA
ncbi:MAG TPA: SRPBCC family protein [Blastocatellia bacterium]|nr:SRPBCC family protein [Blastocatellia bacterium]HMX30206.1 SRPBCC family protein [Blastocatellia bacterium]HNG30049.1 SRPBCC family protein [Blastocatellia bacterium]